MEETGEPLKVADPRSLGGFTVRGRLAEQAAGTVYSGRDYGGRQVVLVVLVPQAASDPAVRDRFAAAIAAMEQEAGRVVDAAPEGPLFWAALASQGPEGFARGDGAAGDRGPDDGSGGAR
ncbi:hypothetical protein ACQEU6_29585 [Spirillospora sp. CA-108201]